MTQTPVLRYRGRNIQTKDVESIQKLIATGVASRRELSQRVCRLWGWVQANGKLCDATCRGLLLALHRAGHITLPAPQWTSSRPRRRPGVPQQPVEVDTTPVRGLLRDLGGVELREVRYGADEQLVNGLVQQYHYLGYVQPVGERLKYLVTAQGRPIACFCWSSAPRHLGPRDRHIGWSAEVRKANLHLVAYQTRFLILPWVQVPHLASHLLGRVSRRLSADWERAYAHPVLFTETFVDPTRYRGTCYRAANWVLMGRTTGRGKNDQTKRPNRSLKDVWGYPLVPNFRERLCGLEA
jgi:Domain of unknown function (DUF4338)